jgi:YfiH family protein
LFVHHESRGGFGVAFTDRHRSSGGGPGVSAGSLDLGDRATAAARESALAEVVAALDAAPLTPVLMRQVHGTDVHVVRSAEVEQAAHGAGPAATADALVTTERGVALVVRVADCVPVVLAGRSADTSRPTVAAVAHAGRVGMVAGIVPRTVRAMREAGASTVTAWVGPHICGRCYEVPESMRAEVAAAVPEAAGTTSWGTPAVDVGAGVRAQLVAEQVEVVSVGGCTREREDLHSYRRDGDRSGRMAGIGWLA